MLMVVEMTLRFFFNIIKICNAITVKMISVMAVPYPIIWHL
jgi:hypothetical protein